MFGHPRCEGAAVRPPGHTARLALGAALLTAPALAAGDGPWYLTVYLQDSWPKQAVTNAQIQQINGIFGTGFDDWSDVANLSVGAQQFTRVSAHWKLGLQVDHSHDAHGAGQRRARAGAPGHGGHRLHRPQRVARGRGQVLVHSAGS